MKIRAGLAWVWDRAGWQQRSKRFQRSFSAVGCVVATLFLVYSLTPSLLPRSDGMQGVISGLSGFVGYLIGASAHWIWSYLGLPERPVTLSRRVKLAVAIICVLLTFFFFHLATDWQNSIRLQMGMEPIDRLSKRWVVPITALVMLLCLILGRGLIWLMRRFSRVLQRFFPLRVAKLMGVMLGGLLAWLLVSGVIARFSLRLADRSYQSMDAFIDPNFDRPEEAERSGSEESLIDWQDLGRQGRQFVHYTPKLEDIQNLAGERPVQRPLRVYVGLNSAETPRQRAELALAELQRVGAFERKYLVIATPTGTGWIDPGSIRPIEFLTAGDVSTVAVQYSYLSSPLALLSEPQYGVATARLVFQQIYNYWKQLPKQARPKLYLQGLSLGALNSDKSFDLYDIIDDPFDGVLWAGPPYQMETWRELTRKRLEGSPAWLPNFNGGRVVRFANQYSGWGAADSSLRPGPPLRRWGNFRIAILQYASDPIVFYSDQIYFKQPRWLDDPRGPDVSPKFRWIPIVTALQLSADMLAGDAPMGHGHNYAPQDYFDAWHALLGDLGWPPEVIAAMRGYLAK